MLLSTLNCDLCRGLCLTFNYVTGAALSEVDSGYPSSHGSYTVEITFFSCKTSLPRTGSLTGSPHLSELSVTSQGGVAPTNATLSPNLSPDTKQASPLVSPLLNDQACPRTDDEEEGRRKVQICGGRGAGQ